jgi:hypothetical protein
MYYEIWQQFDPNGTQYIKYGQLSDFLDVLESPLQIHKPNKYKIISMDIPICKGDFCFCVDVLDALTKDFFARKGNPVEETAELGNSPHSSELSSCMKCIFHVGPGRLRPPGPSLRSDPMLPPGEVTAQADRPGYDPISSTLWRQREEYCARMIQTVWRRQTHLEQLGLTVPVVTREPPALSTATLARMNRMRSGAIVEGRLSVAGVIVEAESDHSEGLSPQLSPGLPALPSPGPSLPGPPSPPGSGSMGRLGGPS